MADLIFDEQAIKYGSMSAIPDEILYQIINQDYIRKSLADRQTIDGPEANYKRFLTLPIVQEVRRRVKQNLWFCIKYFLWETSAFGAGKPISDNLLNLPTHQPLVDMFFKKEEGKSLDQQDPDYKRRIILYPRGAFKSSVDICDTVQWILNFPDYRILYLTAADDLAVGFVDETKGHFVRREPMSFMNLFFPEFCVDEKNLGDAYEFSCPVWKKRGIKRKEPTVYASSIASTLSGWHFEILKVDDVVSNLNSQSEMQCKKVTHNFNINIKMLIPNGYLYLIGTRYDDADMYGEELDRNVGDIQTRSGLRHSTDPRPWTWTDNPSTGTKILIGQGWKLKSEPEQKIREGKLTHDQLTEQDYYLLFPEYLSFRVLRKMESEDELAFESQINQNPRPKSKALYERPLLERHTVNFNQLPMQGPISVVWDFAFSTKKGRDYATGSAAIWTNKGEIYIVDMIRARFNHVDLAKAVVDLNQRWHPMICGIENAAGAKFLEPTILRDAQLRGKDWLLTICKGIDWFPPDTQKEAKRIRLESIYPWLVQDRMFFASHIPHLETLYSEFERCLTSHHHDDIPDNIGMHLKYAPRFYATVTKKDATPWSSIASQDEANWNLLFEENCDAFGRPGMGWTPPPPDPVKVEQESGLKPETPSPDLPPILGAGIYG